MFGKSAQRRWLQKGFKKGWISEGFCYFHETPEFTDQEEAEIDEYDETCVTCIRVFEPKERGEN